MFAVIFAVHPASGKKADYLALAKYLKPMLEKIDGFIDNERFESKSREGWVLSLSTWRDEKAVVRWRTLGEHHCVQEKGRSEIFDDYHLRVGEVTADTQLPTGVSIEEKRFDETRIGASRLCTITEISPVGNAMPAEIVAVLPARLGLDGASVGLIRVEVFESITNPGKLLLLADWKDARTADAWGPTSFVGIASLRHRHVRVIRVYGMYQRDEAPQFYPNVGNASRRGDESDTEPERQELGGSRALPGPPEPGLSSYK
jgi:heme-degrading monooxygenase HmoA